MLKFANNSSPLPHNYIRYCHLEAPNLNLANLKHEINHVLIRDAAIAIIPQPPHFQASAFR